VSTHSPARVYYRMRTTSDPLAFVVCYLCHYCRVIYVLQCYVPTVFW
jgi:hypothetical protein